MSNSRSVHIVASITIIRDVFISCSLFSQRRGNLPKRVFCMTLTFDYSRCSHHSRNQSMVNTLRSLWKFAGNVTSFEEVVSNQE